MDYCKIKVPSVVAQQQLSSLCFEGTHKMDRHLKNLAHEPAILPFAQSHSTLCYAIALPGRKSARKTDFGPGRTIA